MARPFVRGLTPSALLPESVVADECPSSLTRVSMKAWRYDSASAAVRTCRPDKAVVDVSGGCDFGEGSSGAAGDFDAGWWLGMLRRVDATWRILVVCVSVLVKWTRLRKKGWKACHVLCWHHWVPY